MYVLHSISPFFFTGIVSSKTAFYYFCFVYLLSMFYYALCKMFQGSNHSFRFIALKSNYALLCFVCCFLKIKEDHSSHVHQMVCCFVPITTCIYCLFSVPEPLTRVKASCITMFFDAQVTARRWLEKRKRLISTTETTEITICFRCPLYLCHVHFPAAIRSSPCNTVLLETSSWWFLVMHRPRC